MGCAPSQPLPPELPPQPEGLENAEAACVTAAASPPQVGATEPAKHPPDAGEDTKSGAEVERPAHGAAEVPPENDTDAKAGTCKPVELLSSPKEEYIKSLFELLKSVRNGEPDTMTPFLKKLDEAFETELKHLQDGCQLSPGIFELKGAQTVYFQCVGSLAALVMCVGSRKGWERNRRYPPWFR
jgi:hypothetical protein